MTSSANRQDGHRPAPQPERIPVRTIGVTIGMVLATAAALLMAWEVRLALTWIVVAALLSVILAPVTDLVERRLHLPRSLATLLVFLLGLLLLAGVVTVLVRPITREGPQFVDRAPTYVAQAEAGKGPVGHLLKRYRLADYLARNQARLREAGSGLTTPALTVVHSVFTTIVGLVTIVVLTFLMVVEGPRLLAGWLALLPERRQEHVRRVAADCSRAVLGYMTGNLLISVIAGILTLVVLWILRVPYPGVIALFVGFADLIPLVGATLGAVAAIGVAALHSLFAAIVVLVVFVVYQQAENHLLQPLIMSRTVQLNALAVLVSVLLGVQLLGFLGALLAIPVAGVLSVIGRDLWDSYQGRPKPEPTIGQDQVPVSSPDAPAD
jgi:predicted PurR-regulated permease PerM